MKKPSNQLMTFLLSCVQKRDEQGNKKLSPLRTLFTILVLGAASYWGFGDAEAATPLTDYPDYIVFAYPDVRAPNYIEIHCMTSSDYPIEGNLISIGETLPCWFQGGTKTECLVVGPPNHLSCPTLD